MCEAKLLAGPGAEHMLLASLVGVAPKYLLKCIMDVHEMPVAELQQICVYTRTTEPTCILTHHGGPVTWGDLNGSCCMYAANLCVSRGLLSRLATFTLHRGTNKWGGGGGAERYLWGIHQWLWDKQPEHPFMKLPKQNSSVKTLPEAQRRGSSAYIAPAKH